MPDPVEDRKRSQRIESHESWKPPLVTLFKGLEEKKKMEKCSNWNTLPRKNEMLKPIHDVFRRKDRTTFLQLAETLASPRMFEKLEYTPVAEELEKLAQQLVSSRAIWRIRRLRPKKKPRTLKECHVSDSELEKLIRRLFKIVKIEEFFGETTTDNICGFVKSVLGGNINVKQPTIIKKECPISRRFRSKKVLPEAGTDKRAVQLTVVSNVVAAVCWWTLAALRQSIIPINTGLEYKLMWKIAYLDFFKKEMRTFRKDYNVQPVNKGEVLPSVSATVTPVVRLLVVNGKFRPVYIGKDKSYPTKNRMKMIRSMLNYVMEKENWRKLTISQAVSSLCEFRERNETKELSAMTTDIVKCFSAVDHTVLSEILNDLLNRDMPLFTLQGYGKNKLDRYVTLVTCGRSEQETRSRMQSEMAAKRVDAYKTLNVQHLSARWLLSVLKLEISKFFFRRSTKQFKMCKGLPQGHPLSSHLAHVYLADFEKKNWQPDDSKYVVVRYEDDYAILSTEKGIAQKLTEPLFTGKNRHGLKANRSKSQVIDSDGVIKWCGVTLRVKDGHLRLRKRCNDEKFRFVAAEFRNGTLKRKAKSVEN